MKATKRHLVAALVMVVGLSVGACGSDTTAFQLTSAADSHALLAAPPAGLSVLDIRTAEEFSSGHIAGATNLDFYNPQFAAWLDELDKERPYFVYCRSGNRSATAMETMQDLGFVEVYELDGGIVSWANSGFPLE